MKSIDGGATWNDWRTGNLGLASYGWAINPADPITLYAPGDVYGGYPPDVTESGLFMSTDGGRNWGATGLTNTFVNAMAIDAFDADTLYAGTRDYGVAGRPFRGVLKSTDAGKSWFAINDGFPDRIGDVSIVTALAIDPVDRNVLYAGTSGRGIFRSGDAGASWSEFNSGLTNLTINALAIDQAGKHIYAATGAGVFDFQYATPCADLLSPANQSFDARGGPGVVSVTSSIGCSWTAASYANWISLTSDSSGSGTMSYYVAPNEGSAARNGIIDIGSRFLTVHQAGAQVLINNATVLGKKLFVTGENFDTNAVILLNGEKQKTLNDELNPRTRLIGSKTGKRIKPGDKLQVRNPNGTVSQKFNFRGT
jgi:hypothetical protein